MFDSNHSFRDHPEDRVCVVIKDLLECQCVSIAY